MEHEKPPSSTSQNSPEPSGLLRILWAAFSGVLFGVFLSKLKPPAKGSSESIHPQNNSDPEKSLSPRTPLPIPPVPPTPTEHYQPDRRKDNTPKWKVWTEIAAVGIAGALLVANIFVTVGTWKAAIAAKSAAETAAKQLELTDRPWVTVDMFINSPLISTDNGVQMDFVFVPKNIGHSPAQNVSINPHLVPIFIGEDVREMQKRICESAVQDQSVNFKYVLFPNEPYSEPMGLSMSVEAINAHWGKLPAGLHPDPIPITILGCVDYTYETSQRHHQTGFAIDVLMKDGRLPLKSLLPLAPSSLILRQHASGGHFAN